ncbi:hypothetical protein RIF29_34869 [Crotalaria pallida]|uniref:Uncharacterized protein n=1 Tax=Crotalaria pallida TaxID=3830 RepID=A0AAN9E9L5_CROPI
MTHYRHFPDISRYLLLFVQMPLPPPCTKTLDLFPPLYNHPPTLLSLHNSPSRFSLIESIPMFICLSISMILSFVDYAAV